ncbi:UNVERIFIED_CONTAM: hypothetical protein Sradi_1524300 [Sesamum radiatum]|uniref:Uncharacterized protein n=1 Tax=Sesamum radiatum TaxID=300843 RepID=A0AAW2U779_SESRA
MSLWPAPFMLGYCLAPLAWQPQIVELMVFMMNRRSYSQKSRLVALGSYRVKSGSGGIEVPILSPGGGTAETVAAGK